MIAERWCGTHCEPLLELRCCFQHGWIYDNASRTRTTPNFEVEAWLVVINGIVVAECDLDRIRWLRHPFEGGRKLADRELDGRGGRAWSIDVSQANQTERRREAKLRATERRRAAREGREPEAWAVLVEILPVEQPSADAP